MSSVITGVSTFLESPSRRKFIRYAVVSVISVIVTVTVQVFCYGLLHVSAGWSAIIASSIAAVPSFYLNRSWVWKKSGRSHMRKEVLPFWAMAFIGLAFSTVVSDAADNVARDATTSHAVRTVIVSGSNVLGFAFLWVLKFVIFNKILFAHREQELEPALDGRTGFPT